jgi:hypothetical protein
VLPVLSCVSQSMDRGVPAYHFADQPLAQSYPSCLSYCISPTWHICNSRSPALTVVPKTKHTGHASIVQAGASRRPGVCIVQNPVAQGEIHSEKRPTLTFIMLPLHGLDPSKRKQLPLILFREKQSKVTKCQISRGAHELRRADAFQDSCDAVCDD